MMIAAGALWIQRRLEASVGVGGDSDDGRRKLHGNNRSGNWRARAGAGYEAEVVGRTMTTTLTTGPRESGGGKICGEASGRPVFKSKLWTTVSLAAILFATLASTGVLFKATEARYIHSTYRFSPGELGGGDQPLASSNGYHAPAELSRRQDDDGEADNNDGDEDDDDQRAAASYRNQDDNGGAGGGEGGNGGDNYGDNESDGPYEETPVEQEGQADLERFFDDHLGASDRDGMDKENLPTNLVSLLSEPPGLANFNAHNTRLPVDQMLGANSQPLSTLTVVPLAPVMNPTVHPREEDAILRNHIDPMSSLPTIQTSFIRLPGEKMVITHQVTARSSSDPVSSSSSSSSPPPPKPLKFTTDDDDETYRRSSWHLAGGGENQGSPLSQLAAIVGAGVGGDGWQLGSSPFITGQQQQLRISPTESLTPSTTTTTARTGNSAPTWSNDAFSNAATGASSNRIVATEDDDFGRVYVTNETNRPFKIDALGGFDPEEDFMDAAKELEVVPTDRHSSRTTRDRPDSQASSTRGLKRRSNQQQRQSPPQPSNDGGGGDDRTGDNASGPGYTNDEQQQRHNNNNDNNNRQDQEQASSERGGTVPPGQEISFNDPDTDMMYEDASETDEVTFGQDDPYQTDLEAEMRQQEYEKLLARRGPQQTNYQPSTSGSLNVVVDNGGEGGGGSEGADGGSGGARGDREGAGADNDEEDDMDADLDSRYDHDEPATTSSRRQRESMTSAAAALEPSRRSGIGNSRRQPVRSSDIDDEGGWVNDGVDEMDIPSQSHQNSVLEKAEKHDEAVRRAAAADEKAEVAAAEADKQRDPDGGGGNDGSSAESGQTNDNGEENLRMPNADYLKNDFVEDDSGYAA